MLVPHSSKAFVLNGISIEDMFSRIDPSDAPFQKFSPEEYRACQKYLSNLDNFKTLGYDEAKYSSIMEMPPTFMPHDESTMKRQSSYELEFAKQAFSFAKDTLFGVLEFIEKNISESVVIPIWRAGLAFADLEDPNANFLHVGAKRDPETLKANFYYTGDTKDFLDGQKTIIISDPMIGTGNTIFESIDHIMKVSNNSLPIDKIVVVGLFITPEAATRILSRYPEIKVFAADDNNHLDKNGWVINNDPDKFLGDFGDLLRARGLTPHLVEKLHSIGSLSSEDMKALVDRMADED